MGTSERDILTSISPDGTVIVSKRIQATLFCWMNLRKFPFDEQFCSSEFESCKLCQLVKLLSSKHLFLFMFQGCIIHLALCFTGNMNLRWMWPLSCIWPNTSCWTIFRMKQLWMQILLISDMGHLVSNVLIHTWAFFQFISRLKSSIISWFCDSPLNYKLQI